MTSLNLQPPLLNTHVQLFAKVQKKQPGWQPPFILCDALGAGIKAVQLVYGPQTKVFLCHWHVQRSWQKNLVHKVFYKEHQLLIFASQSGKVLFLVGLG
jgi:hypothetical protein